ncbi:molecular chaperone DnaJ [Acholeplasma granularum]|uniref:molecular chaperone DnaJ n=1 Tax=Acholeplasma granularum TaxID=264635 RepID=UPI0004719326|nr:molecular chaperone DnaJ [Acholeplasma granularum]
MAKRDYYDVLGIPKTASADEIKKAYRSLAKKYHPDVSKEKDAEAKFKEVQEAYDVLNDQNKKAQYDRYGHAGTQGDPFGGFGGGGFGGGFGGFDDIISQFFGGGSRQQKRTSNVGEDIQIRMTIDFMEAVLGTTKQVSVDITEDCHHCHGSGAESSKDVHTCTRCHGTGYVNVDQRTMFGTMRSQQVCPTCQGNGQTIDNKCHVCSGNGRTQSKKSVDVKIPAGVDNEMTLRVPGYGHGGRKGGESGDLYITFRVKPHKIFKRRGSDIILDVPITFTQAALGDKIDIPTIHGDVELNIPAGIQTGTQLRLKNKGTNDARTGKTGDQHVIINVETPKNLSSEEKKLFEQLSKLDSKRKKSGWDKFKSFFSA